MKTLAIWLSVVVLASASGGAAEAPARPDLAYRLTEGQNLNAFVREGPVAAHLLLRSGTDPRILIAFPAGNSGTGQWFAKLDRRATWRLDSAPRPIILPEPGGTATGRSLHGIEAVASIDAPQLEPLRTMLTSIRFLRDYQSAGRYPDEVGTKPIFAGTTMGAYRRRIDGAPGYYLKLEVIGGQIDGTTIRPGADGRIRLRITAATGETPLTPIRVTQLLNANAAADPAARNALAFLSYREKFLAGSWRFNTYFGRDTLMSVRLLMPALQPVAVESGLNAVIARLAPGGEVAHEEGIGEFAVVQNRKAGRIGDAAELDYGMVDDDYMLGPVAADYLLGPGRAGARGWLAKPLASESRPGKRETVGAALVRNLRFVLAQATPFAAAPSARTLIAIKPGRMTGEWRDSEEGLGRGIYAYDVNAALVPAAIEAADRLLRAGLLDAYLTPADRAAFGKAGAMAQVWHDGAPPLFRVDVPAQEAAARVRGYAATLGIPSSNALDAQPLAFHALSLTADGTPVPIVNSDEGFALLFGRPSATDLDTYVGAIMRPFPVGLMTDVGMVVANPAFADAATQARFTPAAYHGAVIWSWQQALMAAGLERQLTRADLPPATRARLVTAQAALWRAISAGRAVQSSELWSWTWLDGRYRVVAFGAGKTDVDESNAAQLWSTVYLAVRPPAVRTRRSR